MWLRALRSRSLVTSPSRVTVPRRAALPRVCLRLYSDATPTPPPPVTKIEKLVLDSIKATGPLPFATYMQLCLSHPTHGYYTNPAHPVFGTRGDFTTSPEISQVFGELVGIWLLSQWMSAGRPPAVRLVELGPGRGTLMGDILRVIAQFTKSANPLRAVHLVETSRPLRAQQAAALTPRAPPGALHWHDALDEVPAAPGTYTMLVAHEFFDALSVHVLQKTQQGWNEVLVASSLEPLRDPRRDGDASTPDPNPTTNTTGPDPDSNANSNPDTGPAQDPDPEAPVYPRLRRVLSPTPTGISTVLGAASPRFQALPEGAMIEVSPAAYRIARRVGEVVAGVRRAGVEGSKGEKGEKGLKEREGEMEVGGCGLIVDYGGSKVYGDSFRAFKNHEIVDVFHRPGECDLTANVDFAFLEEAMGDLVKTHGPISQRAFLERMGLGVRVDALVRAAESGKGERGEVLRAAAERLVDRLGMGTEYRVMGITAGAGAGTGEAEGGEAGTGTWPFVEIPGEEDK